MKIKNLFSNFLNKSLLVVFLTVGFSGSLWGYEYYPVYSQNYSSIILLTLDEFMTKGGSDKNGLYNLSEKERKKYIKNGRLEIGSLDYDKLYDLSHKLINNGVYFTSGKFLTYGKTISEQHLRDIQRLKTDMTNARGLSGIELVELGWIFAKNSTFAVADIYTRGKSGNILKLASKSKYVWWAKEVNKLNKLKVFKNLIDSKKFKIFVKLIETSFDINKALNNNNNELASVGIKNLQDLKGYLVEKGFIIKDNNEIANKLMAQEYVTTYLKSALKSIVQAVAKAFSEIIKNPQREITEGLKTIAIMVAEEAPIIKRVINAFEKSKEVSDEGRKRSMNILTIYDEEVQPEHDKDWINFHTKSWKHNIKYTIDLAYAYYPLKYAFSSALYARKYLLKANAYGFDTNDVLLNPSSKVTIKEAECFINKTYYLDYSLVMNHPKACQQVDGANINRQYFATLLVNKFFPNDKIPKEDKILKKNWGGHETILAEKRIVKGYIDGTFRGTEDLNFFEMLVMIINTMDYRTCGYVGCSIQDIVGVQ